MILKRYKRLSCDFIRKDSHKIKHSVLIVIILSVITIVSIFILIFTVLDHEKLRRALCYSLLFVFLTTAYFLINFYMNMAKMAKENIILSFKTEKAVRLYCWIVGSISGVLYVQFFTLHYQVSLIVGAIGLIKCIQIGRTKKSMLEKMNR